MRFELTDFFRLTSTYKSFSGTILEFGQTLFCPLILRSRKHTPAWTKLDKLAHVKKSGKIRDPARLRYVVREKDDGNRIL